MDGYYPKTLIFSTLINPNREGTSVPSNLQENIVSTYNAYVTRVIDGDTFETRNNTIRIAGINAPESDTLAGIRATNYLKSLIENKEIIYEIKGTGYYGRTLANVWRKLDRLNIGDEMVRSGHAERI